MDKRRGRCSSIYMGQPWGQYPPGHPLWAEQQQGYAPQQQGYAQAPYYQQPVQQWGGAPPIGVWTCPYCRAPGRPVHLTSISTAGWILAIVLFFVCLPIFWIPLLSMKSYQQKCPTCHSNIGGGPG